MDSIPIPDEHKRLVRKLMEHFESMGLIVTCACSGYVDCEKVKIFEPDVRAQDINRELDYIGEAKTCGNINNQYTKQQFQEFANRVMTRGKSIGKDVPFYIIISKGCESELRQVLVELGLEDRKNIHVIDFI